MRKQIRRLLNSLLVLLLLSGCWDRWELNELSLIVGMAIDKDDTNYILTMQAMNPSEIASQETGRGYAQAMNVQEKSETIHESLRKMVQKSPRRSFISQLKVLIISEEVAQEGLEHVLDFFFRDHEVRSDFYIVIARDNKASEILQVITPLETLPSQSIYDSIRFSLRSYSGTKAITMDELYQEMMAEGIEPTVMGITVEGDLEVGKTKENAETNQAAAKLRINGIALFQDNKLIDWFTEDYSKGLDYLTENISDSVTSIKCPSGGELALESRKTKRELDVHLTNDTPSATYSFTIESSISEVDCQGLDLASSSDFAEIQSKAENEFRDSLLQTVQATQALKSDAFGIGQAIYRKYPTYWETHREDWPAIFAEMDIDVQVEINLTDSGSIINSFSKRGR
ncbi:spore germination protein KC [Alkalihalobacillus xiaoxiensis]|uniref:Spore germination protein KC n=1 Tax=Shouchella xiaoxiensis TaxID=766895 RepID=A0ABS2SWC6_9BACI|nr:Ger(x)C family spore germination protein [Shouchella xiaoxiensis]MBM7838764.1 spore germination protein KC [Shouchella xiaoxiensis]